MDYHPIYDILEYYMLNLLKNLFAWALVLLVVELVVEPELIVVLGNECLACMALLCFLILAMA